MTNKEAIEQLEKDCYQLNLECGCEGASCDECHIKMSKEALEKTFDKDCSRCKHRNRCSILDNFIIDYCSEWGEEEC